MSTEMYEEYSLLGDVVKNILEIKTIELKKAQKKLIAKIEKAIQKLDKQ